MEQELRHLMKRLKVILDETGAKDDNLSRFAGDSFMQLRSRALRKTKEVSDLCDERDEHNNSIFIYLTQFASEILVDI